MTLRSDENMNIDDGEFKEYKRLILNELKNNSKEISDLKTEVRKLRDDIIVLKTKAAAFGATAGLAVGIILKFVKIG